MGCSAFLKVSRLFFGIPLLENSLPFPSHFLRLTAPLQSYSNAIVKSCYQSLHTLLQPIKTKFPGTELALKLVEDAFSMLSNCEKRSAYDLKRNACREDYESFNIRALSCQNIASKETVSTANNSSVCERGFSSQSLGGSCRTTTIFSEDIGTLGFKLQNSLDVKWQCDKIICQQPSNKVCRV